MDTGCHVLKLFANCVLVVVEITERYNDCYSNGDASYKDQNYLLSPFITTALESDIFEF